VKEVLRDYPAVYVKTHPKGHEVRGPVLDVYVQCAAERAEEAEEVADRVAGLLSDKLRAMGGVVTQRAQA